MALLRMLGDMMLDAGAAYAYDPPYHRPAYEYNEYNQYNQRPARYEYRHPQYDRYHGGRQQYATETYRVTTKREKKVRYSTKRW